MDPEKLETEVLENESVTETITMDDLTADEEFPEVKENAIAAVQQQKEEEAAEKASLEAQGVKLKKDGTPAKKRGRKPKTENGLNIPDSVSPNAASPSLRSAFVISGILEQMQVVMISDDFILTEFERDQNVKAWADCLDYYGGVELSPPMALAMNHAGIIIARSQKEKTKSKMALAKAWLSDKISSLKWSKKDALSDNRSNDERKDNIRKEESSEPKKAR